MAPLFQDVPYLRLRCLAPGGRSRLQMIWAVARELRALRATAVLIYTFGIPHLVAAAGARLAGVRKVYTWAGNPAPCDRIARRKWQAILWLSSILGAPVNSVSISIDQSLRELRERLPRGSGAIPIGCDVAGIAKRARAARRLRRRDGPLVVGMVARLDPIKDQATLIRAFAEVAKEYPQAELWLVGDGARARELCDLAAAQGIAERVVFWGPRRDVPELLGQMDLFAFSTTRDEGCPNATIEAMAAGLPVIASDVPGCREVLDDGAAGVLVPAGDHAPLARAICRLLGSENERAAWAGRGLERAAERYDARLCAEAWYDVLLEGQGARA
jgi:glycosyltransferase involved in cell wall biosynthesis